MPGIWEAYAETCTDLINISGNELYQPEAFSRKAKPFKAHSNPRGPTSSSGGAGGDLGE